MTTDRTNPTHAPEDGPTLAAMTAHPAGSRSCQARAVWSHWTRAHNRTNDRAAEALEIGRLADALTRARALADRREADRREAAEADRQEAARQEAKPRLDAHGFAPITRAPMHRPHPGPRTMFG